MEEERKTQMKKAIDSYEERFGKLDLEKSYMPLFEVLWYSDVPCTDIKGITSGFKDELSFIKKCYWKKKEINCSAVFQKRPTNRGMCCTFNMKNAEYILKSSRYQNAISSRQSKDTENGFDSSRKPQWYIDGKEPKTEAGIEKGLTLIVDGHSNRLSSASVYDDFQGFPLIIQDNNNFPILGVDVARPGFQNNVKVSAHRVESLEETRQYRPEQRNCYFPDEYELKVHQQYSRSNCILECKLEFAAKCLTTCNEFGEVCDCQNYKSINDVQLTTTNACIPWYYPADEREVTKFCNPWNTEKFRNILNEQIPTGLCKKCLPDCSITKHATSITYAVLQKCDDTMIGSTSMLCNMLNSTLNPTPWVNLAQNVYTNSNQTIPWYLDTASSNNWMNNAKFSNKRTRFPEGKIHDMKMFSSELMKIPSYDAFEKDIGIINVVFADDEIPKYVTSNKMHLADFLTQIGGSLGFFMGVSVISLIEIIYWIVLFIVRNIL